jgi:small-conductance mechanosensitive channel
VRTNKAARNEQRKLLASWLNTLAGATVTVGVLAPAAGVLYGFSVVGPDRSALSLAGAVLSWLASGVILHLVARSVLGGIEE